MATKDQLSLQNDCFESDKQCNNFNLNQKHQPQNSFNAFSEITKKTSTEIRKSLNYVKPSFKRIAASTKLLAFENAKNDSPFWNKLATKNLPSHYMINYEKMDEWKKEKDSNTLNRSSLSLHITANEKMIKASTDLIDGSQENFSKQIFVDSMSALENRFEFPRQQNGKVPAPEVSQFKASQRLLNPNENGKEENSAKVSNVTIMPPTLHHPILKEIFEELLKKRAFQQNNFSMIQPLLLAGKECLAAFIELLRQVRSVTMLRSRISFELQNCFLSSESFPLGLWKMMALYIPQLIVSDFDEAYQMSMIEMMENSTRLRRIEASFDLNTEAWRYLLNTSVTEISAPIRSLIDIGKLDEHLYANIGIVETFIYIDDSALFEEFLVNFRIPCKNLKIQNVESWTSFWDVILNNFERVNFETLEKLVLKFRVKEQLPNFAELELPNRLEALQIVFPNLKELDMKIKFDDYEEYTIFGTNFVPHFLFLQLAVNELTNQIRQANIQYKLSFQYCRTQYIDWPHDDVATMEVAFISTDFLKVDESDIGQKWVHENEISESKNLKITFYLDEFEENSVLYNDMMDDLEIGNFNNYGDGDYNDGDYEDDDLGIDFDN